MIWSSGMKGLMYIRLWATDHGSKSSRGQLYLYVLLFHILMSLKLDVSSNRWHLKFREIQYYSEKYKRDPMSLLYQRNIITSISWLNSASAWNFTRVQETEWEKAMNGLQRMSKNWGTWVVQLVRHLTFDFSSGHDLMLRKFKACIGLCADSAEPAPLFSAPTPLSLSQNK